MIPHVQLRFLFALCAKARQSFAHMCLWPCALKKERTHMVRLQSRVSRAGGAREKRQTQRANARVNLRQGTVPRNPAAEIVYFREHLLKQILQRSLHDTSMVRLKFTFL